MITITGTDLLVYNYPWSKSFFSTRYNIDMRVFSIRYEGLKKDLLFKEFSANFQNFRRIFGIFGVVVVEDFGSWVFRIFGEFSEFSENYRRKKTKNHWF